MFLSALTYALYPLTLQVNTCTARLFTVAPDMETMAKMTFDEVSVLVNSLGLYKNKAKNIIGLSQKLVEEFDGTIPTTKELLCTLPGVGNKTASVYLSQILGIPSLGVDTHVHRVALRWGLTKEQKNATKVQNDLQQVFPEDQWNKVHLQMIYFGREYCSAKQHDPASCPVCCWINGNTEEIISSRQSKGETKGWKVSPQKKNIVIYSDRKSELSTNNELVMGTGGVDVKGESLHGAMDDEVEEKEEVEVKVETKQESKKRKKTSPVLALPAKRQTRGKRSVK